MRTNQNENVFQYFMRKKSGKIAVVSVACLFALAFTAGNNNDQEWVVVQYPWGNVKVIDTPGWFFKLASSSWKYPRNWQVDYDKDWSFKVVFNDGGSAIMNAMVRFSAPASLEQKRTFHQLFAGDEHAIENAVWAHISDAMKSSGPVMSASEHQTSRRGEFACLVQDQLKKGLFEMKRVSRVLQDQFDEKGKPITVYATEVVFDGSGVFPKINRKSPLEDFGISIAQFSITEVIYDEQTQKQFSQKKEAFLSAESSKAQREKEVQQRLMVEEKGRREKAESESIALKRKAEEVINAQREKEVEELKAQKEKIVAETNAAMHLAVSQFKKQEAETRAKQEFECAKINKMKSIEEAEASVILASAKEKSLRLGGAISEKERVLAEIERDKSIGIAESLSKIKVPGFIINSSAESSNGSCLLNMVLMKQLGILPDLEKPQSEGKK